MSLNPGEQDLFNYIEQRRDEKRHWQDKVMRIAAAAADHHEAAAEIDAELVLYYRERASVVRAFREAQERHGNKRLSLRSLAEYLVRVWGPSRPRKSSGGAQPYA